MHPLKVRRDHLHRLTDLPNIGPAMAADLQLLGYTAPLQLVGADPLDLYQRLCAATHARQDPCVLDTFISVCRFLDGETPRPWWDYTDERKQKWPLPPVKSD